MKNYKFVVLGSGVAAGHAVKELVERKVEHGSIAIITADDALPYDRPPLSKGFLLGEKSPQDILIEDVDFYNDHGIEVRLKQPVMNVDFDAKRLECNPGGEVGYQQLLITTGSKVRRLESPGAELDELYYLRSLGDAQRLRQRIASGGRAAVIGSGFIGMEVASVLARKGVETTMIFPEDRVWKKFFTPEMSAFFQKYFAERGVKFMPNERAKAFLGTGKVERVHLESGREVPVDFVVAGIGVMPAHDLFVGTGLEMNREGIVVNESLQTNRLGVWAAGDVASYPDLIFGKRRRLDHWDNAVEQGKLAARNMTGAGETFLHVPYFFSDVFDLSYEFWGDTQGHDQVIYRGDITSSSFSAWWLKEGRLEAAFVLNRPDEERELAPKWIQEHLPLDSKMLRQSNLPLRQLKAA
jgi:3-phenylpropionate/trans-cinnamate dioxygenase ferredoxin reductase subunit